MLILLNLYFFSIFTNTNFEKGDFMNKSVLKDYNIILFIGLSNLFYITFYGFNYLIDNYSNTAWLYFLIFIVANIIILFFFKGFKNSYFPIKDIKKKYFIRIITFIYCILASIIIIIFNSILQRNFFYFETPALIFIIITTLAALILSFQGFTSIISLSTIFFTIILFFYIFPLFYLDQHYYRLLLPINFSFKNIYKILLLLVFTLDNFLICYYNTEIKNGIKRKHLLIGNIILMAFTLFIIVDSLSLLGSNYYLDTKMSAFLRWQLFKSDAFFENYDILLLIISTIINIFKISVYFDLARIITLSKRKTRFKLIFGVLFLILISLAYYFVQIWEKYLVYIFIVLLILISIIAIYFIKKSMEVNSERNIRKLN